MERVGRIPVLIMNDLVTNDLLMLSVKGVHWNNIFGCIILLQLCIFLRSKITSYNANWDTILKAAVSLSTRAKIATLSVCLKIKSYKKAPKFLHFT